MSFSCLGPGMFSIFNTALSMAVEVYLEDRQSFLGQSWNGREKGSSGFRSFCSVTSVRTGILVG